MKTEIENKIIYFSIVIPTYNRQTELLELLNCLKKQNYKNFEILICDDGSTDDTYKAISSFFNELDIQYFKLHNSGGPASPRNFGIAKAKYDWICFVDSDDLWTLNKLEVLTNSILTNPKCDIFCHPVYILENNTIKSKIIGKYKRGFLLSDFKSLLYNGSQIVNSSLCVKKNIITDDLKYNNLSDYHGIEDYIFLLNLTERHFKIKNINIPLGYYRVHNSNISGDSKKQINKLNNYFSKKKYLNTNNNKIKSLLKYLEVTNVNFQYKENIKSFLRIIISDSSFEIKLKSFIKAFYLILK